MTQYGKVVTNMNINGEGNTSGKKTCSQKVEYIRLDDDGFQESINVYNDGFSYKSKPLRLPMPRLAEPITEEEFLKHFVE